MWVKILKVFLWNNEFFYNIKIVYAIITILRMIQVFVFLYKTIAKIVNSICSTVKFFGEMLNLL